MRRVSSSRSDAVLFLRIGQCDAGTRHFEVNHGHLQTFGVVERAVQRFGDGHLTGQGFYVDVVQVENVAG